MDVENMVNVAHPFFNHKEEDCPLVGPQNIRVKNTREALAQHIVKHPSPKAKPEQNNKRKTPVCSMISRQPSSKMVTFDFPSEDQDEEGNDTIQEEELTPSEDNVENNNNMKDDPDTNDLETYNTDLTYIPFPSFNSMDVSKSTAHTYEDFYNYQA
eukprot:4021155-Ditylum_brightwellii.AAC.1